jgi:hypothetical protein
MNINGLRHYIFEFDNNSSVANGNIAVTIGDTLDETCDNFRSIVESNTEFTVV